MLTYVDHDLELHSRERKRSTCVTYGADPESDQADPPHAIGKHETDDTQDYEEGTATIDHILMGMMIDVLVRLHYC